MAVAVEMPQISDTMEEGVLVSWQKSEGDPVSDGDVIAEVETDKATMDLEAYDDGVLLKQIVGEGETIPVGQLIAVIGEEGEDISEILSQYEGGPNGASEESVEEEEEEAALETVGANADVDRQEESSTNGRIKASPLARRMAQEEGLDLQSIDGSGPAGRIIKRDIEEVLSKRTAPSTAAPAEVEPVEPAMEEGYESEDISQMRKTIAKRLAGSKFTAPHFYLTVDVDMERALNARERLNAIAEEEEGTKISINDVITKASAAALKKHPQVNASYLADEGEIRYYDHVHVAVAVAIDEGLLTPVIRHADQKGLARIARETRELAQKARNRDLEPEQWEGATFTTSNLGMFGVEEFTAIINPPNACILAIGTVRDEAVVENGEIVPGKRMKLTLSCDHRIVDGVTGAQFLNTVKDYLEEPMSLVM